MRNDATSVRCFPIMGQNDRRSPIINPALLPPAFTVAFAAILMAIPPASAQTLHNLSFGANRHAEAADAVRDQGRHLQLTAMAEARLWIQRGEGQALHLQPAAVSRRQAKRDAGLCYLGAVRD